jgi:hypothetical protein
MLNKIIMEFYEVEWEDNYGVKMFVSIPYSEIIAWDIRDYKSFKSYVPVVRHENFKYKGKTDMEGAREYLKWQAFLKRNM